jgi:hypothetical protein
MQLEAVLFFKHFLDNAFLRNRATFEFEPRWVNPDERP